MFFFYRFRLLRVMNNPKSGKNFIYYMVSSAVSRQEEPNRAMWLATRAGKMEVSCPFGTTRCIPQKKFPQKPYNKSFIDQACSINNPYINITLFSAILINGIVSYVIYQWKFSSAKLNHANFTTNEKRSVQRPKWSPTANDRHTGNDPQTGPQMIPNCKWFPM